jgi:hypothetical protein
MRKVTCFVLAAVLAAAPASAQNEPVADNAVDMNAATTAPLGNEVVANDVAALPPAEPVETTETAPLPDAAPAPAPRSSGGFPWGVIGLVGLVGLLGRKRRD